MYTGKRREILVTVTFDGKEYEIFAEDAYHIEELLQHNAINCAIHRRAEKVLKDLPADVDQDVLNRMKDMISYGEFEREPQPRTNLKEIA